MHSFRILTLLSALVLTSCQSTKNCCGDDCKAQTVVETTAKQHPDVVRLTLHCTMDGKLMACASTSAAKRGKASDSEDVQAIAEARTIVLREGDALDVTVPIGKQDGVFRQACGVTLRIDGREEAELIAKATAIANAVAQDVADCCKTCCGPR